MGAITGMVIGLLTTSTYIFYFKFLNSDLNIQENWFFGISPEGFGIVGALINFLAAILVSMFTKPPNPNIYKLVENIRLPN